MKVLKTHRDCINFFFNGHISVISTIVNADEKLWLY